jgi:magnesium transporter
VRTLTFIPLIIGLAGNVGIQSSTVLVRAFATGEVGAEREAAVLASEVLVGLIIGLLCGLAALGVLAVTDGDFHFGLAVGAAIAVAATWAAFLGSGITILCQRMKIDPAVVAGPFLIALSDVSGSAIFVSVAHLLGTVA